MIWSEFFAEGSSSHESFLHEGNQEASTGQLLAVGDVWGDQEGGQGATGTTESPVAVVQQLACRS